jgi:hypothetical protein
LLNIVLAKADGYFSDAGDSFKGPPDGAFAYNGLVVDPFGNFYGATVHGGDDDDGSVYKFTP